MPTIQQAGLGVEQIIGEKRTAVLQLAAQYGVSDVRVFGSVARSEATPESDVDFLVTFPPDRSIYDLVSFWLDLKELLGLDVDLSTDQTIKDYVRPYALRDAVSL